MNNQGFLWLIIGGIAVYVLYQMSQSQQTAAAPVSTTSPSVISPSAMQAILQSVGAPTTAPAPGMTWVQQSGKWVQIPQSF